MNEQLLKDLAAKLGTTADHLWGVLIRQAPISIVSDLLLGTLGLLLALLGGLILKNILKDKNYDGLAFILPFAICVTGCVMFVAGYSQAATDGLTCLLNPEYWALKQILNAIPR